MLIHSNKKIKKPKRVVILGAGGFISKALEKKLKNLKIPFVPLSRRNLDLIKTNSEKKLKKFLKTNDCLIFIAAKAPVKNAEMLVQNLIMCKNVCNAVKKKPPQHLIYISSDAVYTDSLKALNEKSSTQPTSLHGIMHISREVMLKNFYKGPMCCLRPTLIYGSEDPHNGYGPNQFLRLAKKNKPINIFGEGEELRDHVWVNDVAEVIVKVVLNRSSGVLNIASGEILSFKKIAKLIIKITKSSSKIKKILRKGPMPHNGYRPFNIALLKKSFPKYSNNKISSILNKIKDHYK